MHSKIRAVYSQRFPEIATYGFGGLECGSGWYCIIGGALAFLDQVRRRTSTDVRIAQVKEKFGTLRFYVTAPMTKFERNLFDTLTEVISGTTCEICGAPGKTGGEGWVSTLCERHRVDHRNIDEDGIVRLLLAQTLPEGLLSPREAFEFCVSEKVREDRFRLRRYKLPTVLPDVSKQPLDDLLTSLSDQTLVKEEAKAALIATIDEGVEPGFMPVEIAP